jgi:hypothetical protein
VPGRPERAAELNLPPPYRTVATDPVLGAFLLELPHRPRAYVASEVIGVDRRRAMEFALDDRSIRTDRTVVESPVPPDHANASGLVRLEADGPKRVVLSTRTTTTSLLVLNDVYAEGWRASIDGRDAEIVPANYLARGVWIPPGDHLVTFEYETSMLREGFFALTAGALTLLAWALVRRIIGRDHRPSAALLPRAAGTPHTPRS